MGASTSAEKQAFLHSEAINREIKRDGGHNTRYRKEILITGCSNSGVSTTMEQLKNIFPKRNQPSQYHEDKEKKMSSSVEFTVLYKGLDFRFFGLRLSKQVYHREPDYLIFCVSLSEYNEIDENKKNKFKNSLEVFQSTVKSKWISESFLFLFLNKKDIFKQKLKTTPLTVCFPEYTGENSFEETTAYIEDLFYKVVQQTPFYGDDEYYSQCTSAIDVNDMRVAFDTVVDHIVRDKRYLRACC